MSDDEALENLLREDRTFPPSLEGAAAANAQPSIYQEADEDRGMGIGADRYLTKPFSPRIVLQTIKELIGE